MHTAPLPVEGDRLDWLLRDAADGSLEAMGRLMEEMRPYLLLIANDLLHPALRAKVDASDLVQETFVEARRHFEGFRRRSVGELKRWLREILRCRTKNVHRHFLGTGRKRLTGVEASRRLLADVAAWEDTVAAEETSPSQHAIRNEETAALDAALERLPEHYRQAVLLRNREHLPFAEVGRRLGISEEAARKVWGRAIDQLRQDLGTHR